MKTRIEQRLERLEPNRRQKWYLWIALNGFPFFFWHLHQVLFQNDQNKFLKIWEERTVNQLSVLPVVAIISKCDAWKVQSISVLFDDFLQPSAVKFVCLGVTLKKSPNVKENANFILHC